MGYMQKEILIQRKITMKIDQLTQEHALEIANEWKYERDYAFYNADADEEDYQELITPELGGENYYEVAESDQLIGFFCIDQNSDSKTIDLGLGMKPALTGKGLGKEFLSNILYYIKEKWRCEKVTLSVALFNQRAIKVYEHAGFAKKETFKMETNGDCYEFLAMEYKFK